jgi:hypothetical protein
MSKVLIAIMLPVVVKIPAANAVLALRRPDAQWVSGTSTLGKLIRLFSTALVYSNAPNPDPPVMAELGQKPGPQNSPAQARTLFIWKPKLSSASRSEEEQCSLYRSASDLR